MAFNTFHLFSRLPYELRHAIWCAAIRPNDMHTFAIHNIATVKSCPSKSSAVILPQLLQTKQVHYVAAAPEPNGSQLSNRSAYLWDAGLWTACWESREVMAASLNMKSTSKIPCWLQLERDLAPPSTNNINHTLPKLYRNCLSLIPPLWSQDEKPQQCLFSVRPQQDAFKLSSAILLDWTRQFRLLPNWMENFYNYPSRVPNACRPVKNLVVEFDGRWNRDWPASLSGLLRETFPRGCVATILAASEWYSVDLFIWLIDRGDSKPQTSRVPGVKEAQPYEFYDCDEEYVEIETMYGSKGKQCDPDSALNFIRMLDILVYEADDGAYGIGEDSGDEDQPLVFGNIGVLKPKKGY